MTVNMHLKGLRQSNNSERKESTCKSSKSNKKRAEATESLAEIVTAPPGLPPHPLQRAGEDGARRVRWALRAGAYYIFQSTKTLNSY